MAFDATRRGFFGLLAGAAALSIVARLPAPVTRVVRKLGAYATAQVVGGRITSVTITNSGTGYTSSPFIRFTDKGDGSWRSDISHPDVG